MPNTSRTNTAPDMTPRLSPLNSSGKYRSVGWEQQASREMGLEVGTVHNLAFGPENVFERVATIGRAMLACGKRDLLDRRCAALDVARSGILVQTGEHDLVLMDAFESDAAENVSTAAYALDQSPHTWDTARRRLLKEVAAKLRLIRHGDRLHKENRA